MISVSNNKAIKQEFIFSLSWITLYTEIVNLCLDSVAIYNTVWHCRCFKKLNRVHSSSTWLFLIFEFSSIIPTKGENAFLCYERYLNVRVFENS